MEWLDAPLPWPGFSRDLELIVWKLSGLRPVSHSEDLVSYLNLSLHQTSPFGTASKNSALYLCLRVPREIVVWIHGTIYNNLGI